NIHGCLACEHCHKIEKGICVQKDDMQEVYDLLKDADMLILASPIYYHGISGQLKCTIDRFYAALYPKEHFHLSKIAMFLCSGDKDMYTGAEFSFKGDFLDYLSLEDKGIYTCAGEMKEEVLEQVRRLAEEL
ncbi:MAG: flavodoxin family protein, partial [Erysipelotrichaceae bacterium]|nr:flavodoxin family protein [Erysipelotrichaceae bacterium]